MSEARDGAPPDEAPPGGAYYRGTVKKLFPGSGMGVVQSASGREVPFAALHVVLVGTVQRFAELREGMSVGFDVGWTSGGLRVTRIRAD